MFQGRNPMFQVLRMEVHDTIQEAVIKTIPKKKKCKGQNALILHYCTIALISHASEVMLKMLQARLKHCENQEFIHVQAGFRKGRGTRYEIANIHWIIEKAREFQKNIYFALSTTPKPLTVYITTNCGKFFKRWEYQTTLPAS